MARSKHRSLTIGSLLIALLVSGCAKGEEGPAPERLPAPTPLVEAVEREPSRKGPAEVISEADALLLGGKDAEAADLLIRLVGEYPTEAAAWNLLCFAYRRLGDDVTARVVGERAIALAPTNAQSRFNTGMAHAKSHHLSRAAEHLEMAVQLNPDSPDPIYILGKVYQAASNKAKAQATFREAGIRFPADPDIRRAKAVVENDLNMDGTPDDILVFHQGFIVTDGASGRKLSAAGQWKWAKLVDLGGDTPVILAFNFSDLVLFRLGEEALIELARFRSDNASVNEIARALVTRSQDVVTHYQIRDGQLIATPQGSMRDDNPTSLVEHFAAAATLSATIFPHEIRQGVFDRLGPRQHAEIWATFLLPDGDGRYRLDLFVRDEIIATAKATMSGNQVTALDWNE